MQWQKVISSGRYLQHPCTAAAPPVNSGHPTLSPQHPSAFHSINHTPRLAQSHSKHSTPSKHRRHWPWHTQQRRRLVHLGILPLVAISSWGRLEASSSTALSPLEVWPPSFRASVFKFLSRYCTQRGAGSGGQAAWGSRDGTAGAPVTARCQQGQQAGAQHTMRHLVLSGHTVVRYWHCMQGFIERGSSTQLTPHSHLSHTACATELSCRWCRSLHGMAVDEVGCRQNQ